MKIRLCLSVRKFRTQVPMTILHSLHFATGSLRFPPRLVIVGLFLKSRLESLMSRRSLR